jgi:hypothetical protein
LAQSLRFRSRVDPWLPLLVVGPLAISTRVREGGGDNPALVLLLAAPVLVIFWLIVTTAYSFEGDTLVIRGGPVRAAIPLARITRIARSHSIIAAPALSLRRLMVHFGTSEFALISPADEAGFIAALRERVPDLKLEGLAQYDTPTGRSTRHG